MFFVVCIEVLLSFAQIPSFGRCPPVETQEDFDPNRYIGTWYSVQEYPFIFTIGGKCITATYDLFENGTVSVINRQISPM